MINASRRFQSPLRSEPTIHRNPLKLVDHCVAELRSVAARGGPTGYGLEARCAIVVEMDNLKNDKVNYLTSAPAPAVGDPLHYDAFIRTICSHYSKRF